MATALEQTLKTIVNQEAANLAKTMATKLVDALLQDFKDSSYEISETPQFFIVRIKKKQI